jgi:hypothetical protein
LQELKLIVPLSDTQTMLYLSGSACHSTRNEAAEDRVKPELLALIANLSDDQQALLFEQYRSIRRNSAPNSPTSAASSVRSSPRRGDLAAMHSTRGSSKAARVDISTFSRLGQEALGGTNSDDDQDAAAHRYFVYFFSANSSNLIALHSSVHSLAAVAAKHALLC